MGTWPTCRGGEQSPRPRDHGPGNRHLTPVLPFCNRSHETGFSRASMTKKSVTIRDVARRAGVSVATASRALNGKTVVNVQTRDRILAVMEELGFAPSPAARRLS